MIAIAVAWLAVVVAVGAVFVVAKVDGRVWAALDPKRRGLTLEDVYQLRGELGENREQTRYLLSMLTEILDRARQVTTPEDVTQLQLWAVTQLADAHVRRVQYGTERDLHE